MTGGRGADVAFEVIGLERHDRAGHQHDPPRRRGHPRRRAPHGRDGRRCPRVFGVVLAEKTIKGCWYGSSNVQKDVPKLVELYKKGELKLDELISRTIALDEVNEAFASAMEAGEVARSVISYVHACSRAHSCSSCCPVRTTHQQDVSCRPWC